MQLTKAELKIYNALAIVTGETATHERIYCSVYHDRPGPGNYQSMRTMICHLRNKLEASDSLLAIETVWGKGYKLVNRTDR